MVLQGIKIIGTSHVAAESVREIEQAFAEWKPDIVAVELDHNRLVALWEKRSRRPSLGMLRVGLSGFLFALIGSYVQRKIGSKVGMDPGGEMRRAVELAGQHGARIALIDQRVERTLYRFSQVLSWKEKLRIAKDIVRGVLFSKQEIKRMGLENIDFTKVPGKEVVKKLLDMVHKRYPNIYRVLVTERNVVMARKISHLRRIEPGKKILIVVGAGHVEGLTALLEQDEKMNRQPSL